MTDKKTIVVLPGDGIGKEVTHQAIRLLKALESMTDIRFEYEEYPVGGSAIRLQGKPIADQTLQRALAADAVLFGAIGDPEFDRNPPPMKPEYSLLQLRKHLGVYCNLRPAILYPELISASSLKPEVIKDIDILVVRELTGGLYYGTPAEIYHHDNERIGVNTMKYSEPEIRRIAHKAFIFAQMRKKKVTSVDKANVLIVSQLWREVVESVAQDYPDVALEHMFIDNCAMQLVRNPRQFDVIVTENTFGDIISDEAGMLTGSLGMLPSASLGDGTGMFEPVHGSAPDIAGKNCANPVAMLNTIGMMLIYAFDRIKEAKAIEKAIASTLAKGYHTADLSFAHGTTVKTDEFVDHVIYEMEETGI